jgi:hypothetical protein
LDREKIENKSAEYTQKGQNQGKNTVMSIGTVNVAVSREIGKVT